MSSTTKRIILIIALIQALIGLGLVILPRVVEALPGEIRYRLPQVIAEWGQTPVAAVLPTPNLSQSVVQQPAASLPIPGLSAAPTATATATPIASPSPTPPPATQVVEPTATPVPPTPTPVPTPTPLPVPAAHRLEGLINMPQYFNNCGPANLAIVLNFHGLPVTQADTRAFLKPNTEDRNVSPWQVEEYIEQNTDLDIVVKSGGNLEMIKRFVSQGFPVVVERGYDPQDGSGWYGHYLTIFGYDDASALFRAMDTYLGPFDGQGQTYPYSDILDSWRAFNYTFYVVYPPEQQGLIEAILGPEMLDETQVWTRTHQMATADIEARPEDAFAWFNLGTAYTELALLSGSYEYYQNAAQAFDQARVIGLPPRMLWYQFRPYMAYLQAGRAEDVLELTEVILQTTGGRNVEETYLWQGHALAWTTQYSAARSAYEEALRLNRNFWPAQQALDYLNSLGG